MNTFDNETTKAAPNANDFIGGNYLKKEDIDGARIVTLTDVWSEAVLNAGRKKLVVSFREFEKPLILNKTNNTTIISIHGAESNLWPDKQITLFPMQVEYKGKMTWGVRVKLPVMSALGVAPIGAAAPFGGLPPTTEQAQDITNSAGGGDSALDDIIPF